MREDTWHFEVEVLRIYGRQELWSHDFGARLVSDGPYQPVDAADVRRRVAFGARQDNEFAVRHCCVHRSRWSVVSGARVPRGTSKPLATTSSASEREEAVRPHKSKFPRRSFSRERSPTSTGGPRACYRRRGKLSDGGSSLSTLVGTASSASALEVRGLLRSIGRNKLFLQFSERARRSGSTPQIEVSASIFSPEKDLQHRLEVLALATDGEESCPMEGRPFQRV